MISILLWCVLSLISTINAQQTQVVYEQHYPQSPQNNYQPQQQQQYYQPVQPQVVQYPQYHYVEPQPQQFVQQLQQQYPINNLGSSQDPILHHQPVPMFQAMPSAAPAPAAQQSVVADNNGGFMHRMGYADGPVAFQDQPGFTNNHNHNHMMNVQGIPPHDFSPRRGPPPGKRRGKPPPKQRFNALLPRKKKPSKDMGPPIKMMDMNRIPKPPKYPLYDMGSLGMATPPPPPVMHPMAQVPSNNYATFIKSPRREDRRPPPPPRGKPPPRGRRPPKKHRGRRPPPPNHVSRQPHRKPYPGDKKHVVSHGFDHPMASNLDPLVDSPSLGRPLSYDEYMERPSHSFTNDPWNFDPYASKYNSGMNTYAMKYNYDPLGMNSLDKSQSHLDPNKLSYPGDYYTQDGSGTPGADPSPVRASQIGGWDQAPETYRTPETSMVPPIKVGRNKHKQTSPQRSSQSQNSFNVYDDNANEASSDVPVPSETALNPLKLLAEANPGMEFSIESADLPEGGSQSGSSNDFNPQQDSTAFYTQQLHNIDPISQDPWNAYSQAAAPFQDSGTAYSEHNPIMRQDNVMFDQPQPSQQSHYQQYNGHPNQPPPPPQQQPYHHQQQQQQQQYQQPNNFQPQQQYQQPPQYQYPHQTSPSRHDYENAPSPHTYDDEAQMARRKEDYAVHEQPYSNLSDHYSPGGPGDGLNVELMAPHVNAPIFKKRIGSRNTRQERTPMIELEGLTLFQDILNNKNAIGARNHLLRIL